MADVESFQAPAEKVRNRIDYLDFGMKPYTFLNDFVLKFNQIEKVNDLYNQAL